MPSKKGLYQESGLDQKRKLTPEQIAKLQEITASIQAPKRKDQLSPEQQEPDLAQTRKIEQEQAAKLQKFTASIQGRKLHDELSREQQAPNLAQKRKFRQEQTAKLQEVTASIQGRALNNEPSLEQQEPGLVQKRKLNGEQTVELSVELAPYIRAYKNYKYTKDRDGDSVSEEQLVCKSTYEQLRMELMDSLTAITGGRWVDIFELAIPHEKYDLKNSLAYEVLEDSFVEILDNAVDETIAKYMESSRSIRLPANSLKAIVSVTIDDTHPNNISITCSDNGRGYKQAFLEQVDCPESKKLYTQQKTTSQKRTSQARSISPDIDIFIGGRGLGMKMLIRKVNEGAASESAKRYTENVARPKISDIVFSNRFDSNNRCIGAVINITTSKSMIQASQIQNRSGMFQPSPSRSRSSSDEMKAQLNDLRSSSSQSSSGLTIDTEFSDEDSIGRSWSVNTSPRW